MAKSLQFADDVSLFLLEDEGVVFCEGTQAIYLLNTTAAYIWLRLQEGMTMDQVANALEDTFALAPPEAEAYVREMISCWREAGLLTDGRRKSPDTAEGARPGNHKSTPHPTKFNVYSERRYRVLDTNFRIRFTSAEQDESVHPLLAHVESSVSTEDATTLDIVAGDRGYEIFLDGTRVSRCATPDRIAPLVYYYVFSTSMDRYPCLLAFHSAAVGYNDKCLLLPALSGSGKSSLTAALLSQGYRYLSDDIVFIEDETFAAQGLPFSICLKEEGTNLLTPYFSNLSDLPLHMRPDDRQARYLPPPDTTFSNQKCRSYPVGWIVFPRRASDEQTTLKPVSKGEALRRVTMECAVRTELDRKKVAGLVEWIKGIDCYELSMSSLGEALQTLMRICR